MRAFVAGASGVVGRPLVRRLIEAGHEVGGMASTPASAGAVEAMGAVPVVCDALDPEAVRRAVAEARPDVVISQLTRLPRRGYNPRTIDYGPNNRAREEGGRNLIAACVAAGVPRFVTQSIAFMYAPEGPMVAAEDAPLWLDAPPPFREAVESTFRHEQEATGTDGLEGIVLRYGWFYGPGTYFARGGDIADQVAKRRFPIVGGGSGMFSFCHVEDAAAATVAACERGDPGVYNVVDDDPAPGSEWIPYYAEVLGAKPPRRVPVWLAALVAGRFTARVSTEMRGAANAKAVRELGWEPRYSSWRQGFREALG